MGPKSGSRGAFIRLGMHLGAEASKKPVSKSSLKGLKGEKVQKPMGFCIFLTNLHFALWAPSGSLWVPFGVHFRGRKGL